MTGYSGDLSVLREAQEIAEMAQQLADRAAALVKRAGLVGAGASRLPHRKVGAAVTAVAELTQISEAAIRGRRHSRDVYLARCLVIARCRVAGLSLPQIGRDLGGRDHTSIMDAARSLDRAVAFWADRGISAEQINQVLTP
jgi:chromosomal replication initiation ATPase DnaA